MQTKQSERKQGKITEVSSVGSGTTDDSDVDSEAGNSDDDDDVGSDDDVVAKHGPSSETVEVPSGNNLKVNKRLIEKSVCFPLFTNIFLFP